MILAGTLILPESDRSVRLAEGWLRIRGDRIAEVGEGPAPAAVDLGGPGAIICPGFIDAHMHLPQFDSIGVDGLTLLDWLERAIFPAEARWEDRDYAGDMTRRVVDQLLAHGTTGIAAYATVHHEATRAAIDALHESGLAAIVGQVLMDRNAPPELIRPPDQLIAEAQSLQGRGRVQVAVTPRFAVSCTDELLHRAGSLAKRTGAPIQTHLSETVPECRLIARLFDDTPYTEVYRRADLLGPRTILGHAIWLDADERRTLAQTRSIVAHCPTANLFLQAGSMDLAAHMDAGVRISLGSDVAGGPDRSMVRVARAMIETAKRLEHTPPCASECWWWITGGNAGALGWRDVGRLEPGAWADVLIIEPDVRWRDAADPLSTLLYAWDDRWLRRTIVAGRIAFPGARARA